MRWHPESLEQRFWRNVAPPDENGCWLWLAALHSGGYGMVARGGRSAGMFRAHRVSWEIHNGKVPGGLCVLHKCDVRSCVNPDHLFLGTKRDNTLDMINKGRHGKAKLNRSDAIAIRASDETSNTLAARYGITAGYVRDIRARRAWE